MMKLTNGANKMSPITKISTYLRLSLCAMVTLSLVWTAAPKKAEAHDWCCACAVAAVTANHIATRAFITAQFQAHRSWMIGTFWYDNVLPAMMMMTTQLSAVAMQQVQIIGTFLDAKMQLETQQVLQVLQAQAHKDYRPSEELCSIGTTVRSLASSERKSQLNSIILGRRLIDRQMKNENTLAANAATDRSARLQDYASTYCNPRDNNGNLSICGSPSADRQNKDIDWTRTVDVPMTLEIDLSDGNPGGATNDEADVFALATNLFANNVISKNFDVSLTNLTDNNNEDFMNWRSVVAKRSVAQNSFSTIVGMKSEGSGIGTTELQAILQELGVPATELAAVLGENPSYYAQMELLTKKAMQNPQFYINLYQEPANVNRTGVALQGLELMLLNDMFNSDLRTEMLLALTLEMALQREQEAIEGNLPN